MSGKGHLEANANCSKPTRVELLQQSRGPKEVARATGAIHLQCLLPATLADTSARRKASKS